MTLRIRQKSNVRIFEGTEQKDPLFGPDDVKAEIVTDLYDRHISGTFKVEDGTTYPLPLGDIASPVKGIYIDGDKDADVNVNALGNVRHNIHGAGKPWKHQQDANITSATITAPTGAGAVSGKWAFWGDKVS